MIIRATYRDGVFEPRQPALVRETLSQGETVTLEIERDRSMNSHRHQFAFVRAAWENLPERCLDQPYAANPETLRKHALIVNGFCDVHTVVSDRPEDLAALLRKEGTRAHGYCLTTTEGNVVLHYTPHSQSIAAMGGPEFQRSKDAVLGWLALLVGVEKDQLRSAA